MCCAGRAIKSENQLPGAVEGHIHRRGLGRLGKGRSEKSVELSMHRE
jgi:hypothetical protein